jgi:hypothetical protein
VGNDGSWGVRAGESGGVGEEGRAGQKLWAAPGVDLTGPARSYFAIPAISRETARIGRNNMGSGKHTRRDVLALAALAMGGARASGEAGKRVLVGIALLGGNDSNNLVVPLDAPKYKVYADGRANWHCRFRRYCRSHPCV